MVEYPEFLFKLEGGRWKLEGQNSRIRSAYIREIKGLSNVQRNWKRPKDRQASKGLSNVRMTWKRPTIKKY